MGSFANWDGNWHASPKTQARARPFCQDATSNKHHHSAHKKKHKPKPKVSVVFHLVCCLCFCHSSRWAHYSFQSSTKIHFFSSFLAMKLIATLLVALKIFTATAQDADLPPCPDDIVTREDCHAWCQAELDGFPRGSWKNGWKDITGGIGNVSGCVCTAEEVWYRSIECRVNRYNSCREGQNNGRPGRQLDMSCSRDPITPPPPMPQTRAFCEQKGINTLEDCQAYCVDNSRSPRTTMNADGMLRCECLDGPGGNLDWYCDMSTTPRYVRSG